MSENSTDATEPCPSGGDCIFRCRSIWPYRPCDPVKETPMMQHPALSPGGVVLDDTLLVRGQRYGEFKDQAVIAEGLNATMTAAPGWSRLAPDQKEALRIIQNKVARILNGDPDYSDSWHDIAGYATLVDKRLKSEGK